MPDAIGLSHALTGVSRRLYLETRREGDRIIAHRRRMAKFTNAEFEPAKLAFPHSKLTRLQMGRRSGARYIPDGVWGEVSNAKDPLATGEKG